jgi:hypothetical protein
MNLSPNAPHGGETRDVALPAAVVERLEARLPRTEFETVDEYTAFVLREVLARVEDDGGTDYDEVDEREVESRLESLGYLE